MAIAVDCTCGHHMDLKDEMAGKQVKCPSCGRTITVGAAGSGVALDPAFARDKFLMKQRVLSLAESYEISDESGKLVLFAERPRHIARGILSILAMFGTWGAVTAGIVVGVGAIVAPGATNQVPGWLVAVGVIVGFVAGVVVGVLASAKRHVTFYRDEKKKERLFEIIQDAKFQPVTMTFTVRDNKGKVLALLRKNIFTNILRKKWHGLAPGGSRTIVMAKEDSVILSLLRRFLGPFFGLLRAQYIFTLGTSDTLVGEFNRKFTLLDRYVIDLGRDAKRQVDRRILLAMGIMLDSGERR